MNLCVDTVPYHWMNPKPRSGKGEAEGGRIERESVIARICRGHSNPWMEIAAE